MSEVEGERGRQGEHKIIQFYQSAYHTQQNREFQTLSVFLYIRDERGPR